MKKRIHVNQHHIRANRKDGTKDRPVLTVKTYKSNTYGHEVLIWGRSHVRYCPDKPLSCGAIAWIETDCAVTVLDVDGVRIITV